MQKLFFGENWQLGEKTPYEENVLHLLDIKLLYISLNQLSLHDTTVKSRCYSHFVVD